MWRQLAHAQKTFSRPTGLIRMMSSTAGPTPLDPEWEKMAKKEIKGAEVKQLFWNTPEVCVRSKNKAKNDKKDRNSKKKEKKKPKRNEKEKDKCTLVHTFTPPKKKKNKKEKEKKKINESTISLDVIV